MTGALVTGTPRRKFVPILRGEEWTISAPAWLLGSFYLDFRADPISENAYQDLLDTLLDRREGPPPIGMTHSVGSLPRSSEPVAFPDKATLTSSDESSWPFVWKQLMDTDPHDEELRFIGMEWLRRTGHMDTWPYVWQTLLESDPNSEELRFLGHEWLRRSSGPSWPHVWRTLSEREPNSEELKFLGREYLRRNPE